MSGPIEKLGKAAKVLGAAVPVAKAARKLGELLVDVEREDGDGASTR